MNCLPHRKVPHLDLLTYVFEKSGDHHDRPIYIDADCPSFSLSICDVQRYVRQLVAGFQVWGIKAGDAVCVLSHNHVLYSALYLGIIGSGARFVGANPAYSDTELQHVICTAEVKLLITQPDITERAVSAASECGLNKRDVLIFDGGKDTKEVRGSLKSWRTLLQHGEKPWVSFNDEKTSKSTVAALMSTSGTTGLPKAAAISHYALVSQGVLLQDSNKKPYRTRRLLFLPQFHAFAAPLAHIVPLREGQPTWIMARYDYEGFLRNTSQHGITETAVVPPIVLGLLAKPSSEVTTALKTVKHIWCAGAPLTKQSQSKFSQLVPQAVISQVWGMTEAGWISTFQYPERDTTGSIGRLLPNVEAKYVCPSSKRIALADVCRIVGVDDAQIVEGNNEQGELWVRSPSLMVGYLANPEATTNAFVNGWLKTGDIGYHRDGKWYLTDRSKDMIKVRGWQVSPAEIEARILSHPAVLDAAVIGQKQAGDGCDRPRAFVVLKPDSGCPPTEVELRMYAENKLAKFKALTGGLTFVESIPRSSSGKILRKLLKSD